MERQLPSESQILERIALRLAVKVEHETRHIDEAERKLQVDRLIPVVEALASSEQGRRDLAGVCAAYLKEHRPETSIPAADPASAAADPPRRGGGGRGRGRRRRQRRGR